MNQQVKHIFIAVGAGCAFSICAGRAHPQERSSLNPIVVTGTRTSERVDSEVNSTSRPPCNRTTFSLVAMSRSR